MLSLFWFALLTIGAVFGNSQENGFCNNPADIVFVLDESSSISRGNFTQQLRFVQSVIDSFDTRFNMTHIGVLTFADKERIIFQLRDYHDKEQLKKAVKGIIRKIGNTNTHLALKRTCHEMFSPTYSRPWVKHLAIVITDGDADDPQKTKLEAERCHQQNIEILAIGAGDSIKEKRLQEIASSDKLVYKVESYEALAKLKETLALRACETSSTTTPTTTPPQDIDECSKKIDHIWAISEYAGVIETNYALNFIKKVTNEIEIDPLFVQVGLAPRLCHEGTEIRLNDHDTKTGFWTDLDNYQLSGLYTDQTIEDLRLKGLTDTKGARSDAVKFGILIVDFETEDWERTLMQAELAKEEGIRLIVIGVGDNIREDQLRQLASSDKDYFYARTYSQLDDLESDLVKRLWKCPEQSNANPRAWQPWRRYFEDFYSE